MTRRSKAGGEPIKGRRRKAPEPKTPQCAEGPIASQVVPPTEETEVARLNRELNEALDRQNATSEVLRVISSSRGDLAPVFDAVLQNATRICRAKFGIMNFPEPGGVRCVAMHNVPEAFAELRRRDPVVHFGPKHPLARAVATKQVVHIPDLEQDAGTDGGDVVIAKFCELTGARTILHVPMLKEKELVGIVSIYRQEVRPFTDKQIDLVKNFAAQAVIAVENARLLNELRQRTTDLTERTADLTEALAQQKATSEVLQVISSSPGDLELVFQAMLENATRICEAKFGFVFRFDGNAFDVEAHVGTPPKLAEYLDRTRSIQPLPGSLLDRVRQTKRVSYTADYAAEGIPAPPVTLGGARSTVDVPMLKDGELVGAFSIFRQEVRPFTEKQIALLTNFAAQAVIAIENARLLNELRQRTIDLTERTAELTEALEQQTATSEVLQIISSSPGNLEPVFATMLENAARVCDAKFGNIYRWDGEALHFVATHNTPPAYAEERRRSPYRPYPPSPIGRLVADKTVVHVSDIMAEEVYIAQLDPVVVSAVTLGGFRTFLGVPLLSKGELTGAFFLSRQEVRPFTDKQIELVKNFAAQAVIAIENARLLNELRQRTTDLTERTADLTEALEQQTATSEVLQVISSAPGDPQPVFETMVEKAVAICDAKFGNILRWDGNALHLVASHKTPPAFAEARRREPNRPSPKSSVGRMIATKAIVHVADAAEQPGYAERDPASVDAVELGGVRTALLVPMLKENELVGAFTLSRQEVRPFSEEQVGLVKNFAAQAVVAIENARLLKELRERTEQVEAQAHELSKLNQQLEQRVTDQVGEIERMSRLRRFLPPQVADLIVASGSEKQLESHRREITALFCDLRGFTGFTESADAEDVIALLRDYHAAIGEIIIKYNGTLER